MKRLLTFILILSLLLPAAALAIGDSPYFGQWVAKKHGSTANFSAILYYLFIHENSPCAFFEFDLHHGGVITSANVSDTTAYASQWELVDDHLRIPTSPIAYIDVYYDKDTDTLYTTEWPKLTFVRIP